MARSPNRIFRFVTSLRISSLHPPAVAARAHRGSRLRAWSGVVAGGVLLSAAFIGAAAAQGGRLDAIYEASLGGVVIGKGTWVVTIGDEDYAALVSGGTSGLMKAIGGGSGTTSAKGRILGGQFVPGSYLSSIMYGKKNETIRINLANGNVKDSSIEPVPPVNDERIPVTDVHRRGAADPMTGSLLRVPGTADPVGPDACRKTVAIFDGRMRYDLRLEFKRMETVTLAKSYQGPAVVCSVYFTPLAGYVPDRMAIKYLAAQRDMEITFAPIAGTRVLAPFRIKIPTPIGAGLIEATEFNSVATPRTVKTN